MIAPARENRRVIQALTLVIVALATACGGSGPASPAGGGDGSTSAPAFTLPGGGLGAASNCRFGGGNSACYTATLTVTGATSASGSNTTPELDRGSCQTWMSKFAAENGREVQLPGITLSDGGASFSANLEGWKGPGSYPLGLSGASYLSLGGTGGVIADGVVYAGSAAGATQTATATAVVLADGSITITFSNLADSNDPSRTVSGTAVYACKTF